MNFLKARPTSSSFFVKPMNELGCQFIPQDLHLLIVPLTVSQSPTLGLPFMSSLLVDQHNGYYIWISCWKKPWQITYSIYAETVQSLSGFKSHCFQPVHLPGSSRNLLPLGHCITWKVNLSLDGYAYYKSLFLGVLLGPWVPLAFGVLNWKFVSPPISLLMFSSWWHPC